MNGDAQSDELLALYRRHVSASQATLLSMAGGLIEAHSEGVRVTATDGSEYIDCGGFGVFLLGHGNPHVLEAVHTQLDRYPIGSRAMLDPGLARASAALAEICPGDLQFVYFTTSGAEAVEAAIKLGRIHGRKRLISFEGNYHGKTMGALSVTGRRHYQDPFRPLLPDVSFLPFGDVSALITELAALPPASACVLLEPIQAEGGVRIPHDGYARAVAQACQDHDALLIVDEVQTGLGRTGRWWSCDHEEVFPDILITGKALSGGVIPISAVVATATVYEPFSRDMFLHSSTFAGVPVAVAAAEAAIEATRRESVLERAAAVGQRLLDSFKSSCAPYAPDVVIEARGRGLLIGIEFTAEHLAGEFALELMERRVLVNHSFNAHTVARFTPPATLTDDVVEHVEQAVAESVAAVANRYVHAR